jgi:two-component system, LytTR family, response regulator
MSGRAGWVSFHNSRQVGFQETTMIRAFLADDEELARQKLRHLLREEPDIDVVGESGTASETIELVRSLKPELFFLDICMPGIGGFDIVSKLSGGATFSMPRIIFTTGYDCYASRAFEIHAVDYLLKPFTAPRLHAAVQRARDQILVSRQNGLRSIGRPQELFSKTPRIVFKSRGRILFLPVSEIRWIGAEENYVRISTGTESHLLRETMSGMEQRLDPQTFMRVHRSTIVNLQYVKEVRTESQGEFSVLLCNGQKLAMSRSYHSRIEDLLAQN